MYLYIHTHTYIYIYIYIYTHTHIYIYTYKYTHMHTYTHLHIYMINIFYLHHKEKRWWINVNRLGISIRCAILYVYLIVWMIVLNNTICAILYVFLLYIYIIDTIRYTYNIAHLIEIPSLFTLIHHLFSL